MRKSFVSRLCQSTHKCHPSHAIPVHQASWPRGTQFNFCCVTHFVAPAYALFHTIINTETVIIFDIECFLFASKNKQISKHFCPLRKGKQSSSQRRPKLSKYLSYFAFGYVCVRGIGIECRAQHERISKTTGIFAPKHFSRMTVGVWSDPQTDIKYDWDCLSSAEFDTSFVASQR